MFAYRFAVLNELATIVFILKYPGAGALILPERRIVEATIEDVVSWDVDTVFEKVAMLALMLEIDRDPPGFEIKVFPRSILVTLGPCMVLNTFKLFVTTPLEAVIFNVLTLGRVTASEKRRSWPR